MLARADHQTGPTRGTRLTTWRMFRLTTVWIIAIASARCDCTRDEGTGSLQACTNVTNAAKSFQTFLQNHPIGGQPDPKSQVTVLGDMISELTHALTFDVTPELAAALNQAINDATQVQKDIADGKPVTSAALRTDFDSLGNLCSMFSSSSIITAP